MSRVTVVIGGVASGTVVVLDEPLSFWGGFSADDGIVIDERHPQAGVSLTDAVVVLPGGRGSSSASSVLVEAVRIRTAPAAILLGRRDEILTTGALVARELYDRTVPIVVLDDATYRRAVKARTAKLTPSGELTFS